MRKNRKGGFTLKGLLVIVIILALLAVVGVPILSNWMEKRRPPEPSPREQLISSIFSFAPEGHP